MADYSDDNPFAGPGAATIAPGPSSDATTGYSDENPFAPPKPPPTLKPLPTAIAPAEATRVQPQQPLPANAPFLKRFARAATGAVEGGPMTVLQGAVAPAVAAGTGAAFMGQSAAETTLPPDIAARALADPDRISERDAALAAAQLAVPAAGGRLIAGAASPIARAVAKVGAGAATGAVYSPEDPTLGAVIGGMGGAAHAAATPSTPGLIETAASKAARAAEAAKADAGYPSRTIPKVFEPANPTASAVPTPLRALDADEMIDAVIHPGPNAAKWLERKATPEDFDTWDPRYRPPAMALAPAGMEQRAAGLSIAPETREAIATATRQAVTNPYAPIEAEHPELSDALQSAGAMTRPKAEAFVRQMGERVLADLSPDQREQFETARVAANLEEEARRKTNGAAATARQAQAHLDEVTRLSRADLDAQLDKADAIQAEARDHAAQVAATGAAPGQVQDILTGGQLDADEIRRPAQADYDLAVKKGKEGHDLLQQQATEKQQAASSAAREALTLRKKVRPGVEQEPWFQEALAKHQQMVEPFNQAAAVKAGVDPGALRTTKVGYTRLTPQERIHEELIQRAQETRATEGAGSTVPRTGLALKAIGQKPTVTPLLPAGAEAPVQGPANTLRDTEGAAVAAPTAATGKTASAKAFAGGTNYSTDYLTNVARDAGDKVTKAAKNGVYQALVNESMKEHPTVRKLLPEENPAPGEKLLAFNDQKDIIQPPSKTDPNYQAVQRFAVQPDVADAFARYQSSEAPASNAAKLANKASGVVMRSVLSNPLVAAGHTITEASNVSRGIPAGASALESAATGLPGVKSAQAIARALKVDMEAPETTQRLQRLALSGSLRIGDERGQGWVDAAHHALFGPNGVDTRMRLLASQDFESAWKKAGGSLDDPAYIGAERDYVNGQSGNYVSRNQGTAIQWLNKSGLTPFIAIGRAKLGGSLQAITGAGGPAAEGLGARLLRAQRGPLGQAAAIAAAGYLLSGHSPASNAPGHETDMASGVYHLPDGSFRYFRGDPDDAVATLGKDAKEVYLRKGFVDPSSAAAIRLLEPIATAKPGDKVSESVRAAANTALAFVGPVPALATQLATGRELYLDRDGALGSVQGIHLSKDADLSDRMLAAARNLNAGVAIGMAPATPGGRSGTAAVLGNLNPFTEGKSGTAPRTAADRRNVSQYLDGVRSSLGAIPDPAAKLEAIQKAEQAFQDAGIASDPQVIRGLRDLRRAAAKAQAGRRPQLPLVPVPPAPAYSSDNPFAKHP